MRPKNETARDQLPSLLRRSPGAKAAALAALAQVSAPTMVRMLKEAGPAILRVGQTARTRYYLRRSLRGAAADVPLYEVDRAGSVSQVGSLQLIAPQGCVLDVAAMGWPMEHEFADGVWPHGLPYPLQDMRPQGFLGRQFAKREAKALAVSANPKDWDDDAVLHILLQCGDDTSGNLILGDVALHRWLEHKAQAAKVLAVDAVAQGYLEAAAVASASGVAGSSAAGEFPKFTALRQCPGAQTPLVIVKFSGAGRSATVRRWADLLVCEHLALQAVRTLSGVRSANSRILQSGGRTFLEVERFDRHGRYGRSPLCSLETLEAALLPKTSSSWGQAGELLKAQGWLDAEAVHQLQRVWYFGKLIANSDMHKGNLSFVPGTPMALAPVYDMLPMAYAPLAGGELPQARYAPALPGPQGWDDWLLASQAALAFWDSAAQDPRISKAFARQCKENGLALRRLVALA